MLETWVRIPCERASQFKKSQTAVSTTECHFTLSVVCLIVECTKDSVRVTKKNIQIVVGRLGWKWIERSVVQLLLLKQKKRSRTIYCLIVVLALVVLVLVVLALVALALVVIVVVVVVVVVGQTVGSISSRTLAYDCLCTLELCTASMIATS